MDAQLNDSMLGCDTYFSGNPVLSLRGSMQAQVQGKDHHFCCPGLSKELSWWFTVLTVSCPGSRHCSAAVGQTGEPGLSPVVKGLWELLVGNSTWDRVLPSARFAASEAASGKDIASKTHLALLPSTCQDAIQSLEINALGKYMNKVVYFFFSCYSFF